MYISYSVKICMDKWKLTDRQTERTDEGMGKGMNEQKGQMKRRIGKGIETDGWTVWEKGCITAYYIMLLENILTELASHCT